MIRTTTRAALVMFLLSFLFIYFYGMSTGCFGSETKAKSFYQIGMAVFTASLFVPSRKYYEKQFTYVGLSAMLAFFVVGVFKNSGLLALSTYPLMIRFAGLFFVTTSIILYYGRKYGLFNE